MLLQRRADMISRPQPALTWLCPCQRGSARSHAQCAAAAARPAPPGASPGPQPGPPGPRSAAPASPPWPQSRPAPRASPCSRNPDALTGLQEYSLSDATGSVRGLLIDSNAADIAQMQCKVCAAAHNSHASLSITGTLFAKIDTRDMPLAARLTASCRCAASSPARTACGSR